jgi:oligosaccharide repeat unit polymerase
VPPRRRILAILVLSSSLVAALTVGCITALQTSSPSSAAMTLGLLFLGVGVLVVFAAGERPTLLSFFTVFTASHVLLFVARPAYLAGAQANIDIFTGYEHDSYIVSAALIAGTGYCSACIGYVFWGRARSKMSQKTILQPLSPSRWTATIPVLVLLMLLGYGLYAVYVAQVGGISNLLAVSSGRSVALTQSLSSSSGYFTSGLLFTLGLALLLFAQGLAQGTPWLAVTGLAFLVIGTGPQLLSGSRSVFVPLILALAIVISRIKPQWLTPRRLLIVAFPTFVLTVILPRVLRQPDPSQPFASSLTSAISGNQIADNFLGGLDTAMVDAFAHQISMQSTGQIPFQFGSTYIASIGLIIPRGVWPDKPMAVDVLLNSAIFPATAAKKIGFSFGIYSEPFLNFGIVGVILLFLVVGSVLAQLDRRLAGSPNIFELCIYALAAGALFTLMRGSITFDIQRLLIPAIPVLTVAYLTRNHTRPHHSGLVAKDNSTRYGNEVSSLTGRPASL